MRRSHRTKRAELGRHIARALVAWAIITPTLMWAWLELAWRKGVNLP